MNKKILIMSMFCALLLKSFAQITFESSSLQDIYDRFTEKEKRMILSLENKRQNFRVDTVINWEGKTLSVLINDGNLHNLGIEVKNIHLLNNYDSIVKIFVERALLRLSFDGNIPDIVNTAETYQIRFFYHDKDLLFAPLEDFNELLNFINPSKQFKLTKNDYTFIAEWKNDTNSLKMIFPNSYQLLTGKNKKELDEELLRNLGIKISDTNLPESKEIYDTSKDTLPIIKLKGSSYLNRLSSDTFYKLNGTDSVLIFEKNLLQYSISNLFLNKEIAGNRKLILRQKLYGGRNFPYTILLKNFLNYFENNFRNFVGFEKENSDLIEGTIVLYHKYFNFIHLLYFKTSPSEIFNDNGTITADFYTNIPMHNVSDLFMKYVPEETENDTKIIIKSP